MKFEIKGKTNQAQLRRILDYADKIEELLSTKNLKPHLHSYSFNAEKSYFFDGFLETFPLTEDGLKEFKCYLDKFCCRARIHLLIDKLNDKLNHIADADKIGQVEAWLDQFPDAGGKVQD